MIISIRRGIQPGPIGLPCQLEGIVRATQSALAISHHR